MRQLALFREIRKQFPALRASLANSGGVFLGPDFHFDLVRPGIALYGGAAVAGAPNPMQTVVTAEARVLAVREAEAGETVGYGATETLKRPSRVAILAAGYSRAPATPAMARRSMCAAAPRLWSGVSRWI
jgi:alanine racemase